jgi:hypothetical protein
MYSSNEECIPVGFAVDPSTQGFHVEVVVYGTSHGITDDVPDRFPRKWLQQDTFV